MLDSIEICEVLEDKGVVGDKFFKEETKKRYTS